MYEGWKFQAFDKGQAPNLEMDAKRFLCLLARRMDAFIMKGLRHNHMTEKLYTKPAATAFNFSIYGTYHYNKTYLNKWQNLFTFQPNSSMWPGIKELQDDSFKYNASMTIF